MLEAVARRASHLAVLLIGNNGGNEAPLRAVDNRRNWPLKQGGRGGRRRADGAIIGESDGFNRDIN
jgi:hypothetical protein